MYAEGYRQKIGNYFWTICYLEQLFESTSRIMLFDQRNTWRIRTVNSEKMYSNLMLTKITWDFTFFEWVELGFNLVGS